MEQQDSQPVVSASGKKKPGIVQRARAKVPVLDHVLAASERYGQQYGNFYAGGITYFSVLGIFPLVMVGFAAAGIVLYRDPALLGRLQE